jgi:enoyl-CoA hydratase
MTGGIVLGKESAMPEYQYIKTQREEDALVATLVNPPRNFLNAPMVSEIQALAEEAEADSEVRSLILTGGVEGIFITHYDVGELSTSADAPPEEGAVAAGPELHGMHQALLRFESLSKPVIAAINGIAMGGGCELALGCDFRYMSQGGVIGLPEVRVGILPGGGGTQRMTRLLGTAKALELMMIGNVVDADTAERIGLVHRAVAPERLRTEVLTLARELAQRPPLSVALIKQCVHQGSEMPLREALLLEQDAFWKTMQSAEAQRLMREYVQANQIASEP